MRILEIHKSHYATNLSPESFQQALIGTSEKYRDENALGPTNKPLTKRILAVVQQMHKSLIMSLIKHAKLKEATSGNRKQTLVALDKYLDSASEAEKEPLRAAKGEIQFLDGNHIASAATFAALAELKGAQAPIYWRLAIRSQQILASWPSEPPWEGTGVGSGANTSAPRETLRSMYASIAKPDDWSSAGQIGLIDLKLNRQAEAFKLFTETLQRNSKGPHAEHAAGLMAFTFLKGKSWQELEDLARVMVKNGLVGAHLKVSYVGNKILGTALLEGGLEKYTGADYKASVTKLDEFVRGWKDHSRHDQAFYQLALAHYSSKSYRLALETMINFTRSYPKTKYRRDALVTGGAWSLSLAWEDHVIYFYESHVREFGLEAQAVTSLETLVNLYMGREFYDAASRVMEIQLSHPLIASETKEDIA
ncbi:MAG: outer membrane protein assembly factor BamD, partial [Proteobacteria bacterium]|nr:outer membrane protein assembly factor BamD [Pseudomonadota bacterium]